MTGTRRPFAPHPVTLRQLQYLVAVAEHRSFRKAAVACAVSQPSLSAQVAQAEDLLGVVVFERDRRTTVPTAPGELVLARARAVLLEADALVAAAAEHGDPFARTWAVGVIPTVAPYLLPEIAPALRKAYPRLGLVWHEERTESLLRDLGEGRLDAAVLADVPHLAAFAKATLGSDPFVLACGPSHPLAKGKRRVRGEDLGGARVLLLDDGHCFRDQALAFCSARGAEELGYRATSLGTLAQMVASGDFVTLLPAMSLEARRRDLVVRRFGPKGPHRSLVLAWRARSPDDAALRNLAQTLASAYARAFNR